MEYLQRGARDDVKEYKYEEKNSEKVEKNSGLEDKY